MSTERLNRLLEKYYASTATEAEEAELFQLIVQTKKREEIDEALEGVWANYIPEDTMPEEQGQQIFSAVQQKTVYVLRQQAKVRRRNTYLKWAAAIIVLASAGTYLWRSYTPAVPPIAAVAQVKDVKPGGNKAYLTLADGTVVTLDSAQQVIRQSGAAIHQQQGQLQYVAGEPETTVSNNILTAPRGGQYQVVLADGTKVWLNADSRLKYPTAFTGKERVVELQGEAYFEVQRDPGKPFHVKVNEVNVTVLGTHFNINAYPNEQSIRAVLLEGAVEVSKGTVRKRLKAGELATMAKDDNTIALSQTNGEAAIAWKNGYFQFEKADIAAVMRQLERWYNITVIYKGTIPERFFQGEMQRDLPLSGVIRILEKNQIHCQLQGNQLIVLP